MNLAGVVILYWPNSINLANIYSYGDLIAKLYIMDNTEGPDISFEMKAGLPKNWVWLHDGENKGIASRLNEAAKLAQSDGYTWLLTMDQDSLFPPQHFRAYLECAGQYKLKDKTALFGVQFWNSEIRPESCDTIVCNRLITSGSLINLALISIIGWFDEVDTEYGFKAIQNGFDLVQFKNIYLEHSLGYTIPNKFAWLGLKQGQRRLHAPIRIYYMTRNYLYIREKYKHYFRDELRYSRSSLLTNIKNNILFNKNRMLVIKYLILAVINYSSGYMGKLGMLKKIMVNKIYTNVE
jgi:rhamnosyltransferase